MKRFHSLAPCALLLLLALANPARAQTQDVAADSARTALDAELFYQLLIGELNTRDGEPGAGYSLILDAARKTNDAALYQRAVEIAFQSRSGDSALQAARAWKQAQPQSREANRFVLQILIALNRIADSADALKTEISLADARERGLVLASISRTYARASDKKLAAIVVEQALAEYISSPAPAKLRRNPAAR